MTRATFSRQEVSRPPGRGGQLHTRDPVSEPIAPTRRAFIRAGPGARGVTGAAEGRLRARPDIFTEPDRTLPLATAHLGQGAHDRARPTQ
ncbi:hypothetical protein KPATCC21470_5920 [Kitasatospora purpeofusca]